MGRSQKTILQPDDLLRSLAGRNVKDMKIVFLDDNSIGTDIDLSGFEVLGEVVRYGSSKPEEVPDRVQDADVVIVNKMEINEQTIGTARNLKLVCVTLRARIILTKSFWKSGILHGGMWQAILRNVWHSIHLRCCFICLKRCLIMTIMSNQRSM